MSKTYELPISSKYVAHWNIGHAGRELIANRNDSGHPLKCEPDGENFIISNGIEHALPPSILILGESSKGVESAEIGQFGEGLKLAILVLLREGLPVTINNYDKQWNFSLAESEQWKGEVIRLEETEITPTGQFEVIIKGVDEKQIEQLFEYQIERALREEPNHQVVEGEHGKMYICGGASGDIYVGGVYIMTNYSMPYMLDLNPQAVELNRERSYIQDDVVFTRYRELVNIVIKDGTFENREAIMADVLRTGAFAERLVEEAGDTEEDPLYIVACAIAEKIGGGIACRFSDEFDTLERLGKNPVLLSSVEKKLYDKFFGIEERSYSRSKFRRNPDEILEPIIEFLEEVPEMKSHLTILKAHYPNWYTSL